MLKKTPYLVLSLSCIAAVAEGAPLQIPTTPQDITAIDRNDPVTTDLVKPLRVPPTQLFDERQKRQPQIQIQGAKGVEEAAPEATVEFRTFVLQGSTLLKKNEVEPIIRPFIGERMTVAQLQRLAAVITKLYDKKGYRTSYCYIPPQKVRDGKVVFQCVETRIGRIIITNAEEYNQSIFLRFMKPLRDRPLNVDELAERLKSLNMMPTFIAKVGILRTQQPEVVDLQIDLTERPINTAEITADNFGSRFAGREQIGGTYNVVNPTGFGDILTLQARTSTDTSLSHSFSLGYRRLVSDQGGILSISGGYSDYEVDHAFTGDSLVVNGNSTNVTVNYRHPLLIADSSIFSGIIQYEYRDIVSDTTMREKISGNTVTPQQGIFAKEDVTHVFSVGGAGEVMDRFGGWNALNVQVYRGVEGFFNGMRDRDTVWSNSLPIRGTIKEGVVPDFTLFTASYYRRQVFKVGNYGVENLLNLWGQYTWQRVPSAYSFADGDSGFHTTAEFRFPLAEDQLKLTASYNYEAYYNSEKSKELVGLSGEDSHSVTAGILGHWNRWNIDYYLTYTKALSGEHSIWDQYSHMTKVNFSITKKF